jgi:rhomboid protease GluP
VECLLTWIKTKGGAYGPSTISPEVLITMGANVPLLVKLGGVHRLFTAMFLHAGILHIIMNSASLIAFCAQVESSVTFPLYLAVYIVGGI